ncbi:MAG TPA: helix-turn-helix domain-containing protein [Stellaceae bacterium]|nr:helix-turn-helix domain-containing protein [Stellaceae bacterium]
MRREPKLTQHQRREAIRRREKGEPVREIARTYNVSHSTISRLTAGTARGTKATRDSGHAGHRAEPIYEGLMTVNAPDFRLSARESLTRAKTELKANDSPRLRYAALELRNAMEALTYDRALAFKDDIPPNEYKTWQPRKLMAALLDIDPSIGMTSTIALRREEEYGKPAPRENMTPFGTDVVFTLADLKAHYDAIGSYLHMPSLEQVQSGKMPDSAKLRERCETVVGLIENVLSSPVWNITLGIIAALDHCMTKDCKRPIRKRMPFGKRTVEVQCFECKAEYTITSESDGRVRWTPKMMDAPCSTPDCPEKMALWPHEIRPGIHWLCRGCGARNEIALTVTKVEDKKLGPPAP